MKNGIVISLLRNLRAYNIAKNRRRVSFYNGDNLELFIYLGFFLSFFLSWCLPCTSVRYDWESETHHRCIIYILSSANHQWISSFHSKTFLCQPFFTFRLWLLGFWEFAKSRSEKIELLVVDWKFPYYIIYFSSSSHLSTQLRMTHNWTCLEAKICFCFSFHQYKFISKFRIPLP